MFVAECINIRTIFSFTRVSTFCVEFEDALRALDELLGSVRSEWAQDAILELVSRYGKGAVMPGDVMLGVITVVVERGFVELSVGGGVDGGFVDEFRRICGVHGFSVVVNRE